MVVIVFYGRVLCIYHYLGWANDMVSAYQKLQGGAIRTSMRARERSVSVDCIGVRRQADTYFEYMRSRDVLLLSLLLLLLLLLLLFLFLLLLLLLLLLLFLLPSDLVQHDLQH